MEVFATNEHLFHHLLTLTALLSAILAPAVLPKHMAPETCSLTFTAHTPGVFNAVAFWFELQLTGQQGQEGGQQPATLSTGPFDRPVGSRTWPVGVLP